MNYNDSFRQELVDQGMTGIQESEKSIGTAKWHILEADYQGIKFTYSYTDFHGSSVIVVTQTISTDYTGIYTDINSIINSADVGASSFSKKDDKGKLTIPEVKKTDKLK